MDLGSLDQIRWHTDSQRQGCSDLDGYSGILSVANEILSRGANRTPKAGTLQSATRHRLDCHKWWSCSCCVAHPPNNSCLLRLAGVDERSYGAGLDYLFLEESAERNSLSAAAGSIATKHRILRGRDEWNRHILAGSWAVRQIGPQQSTRSEVIWLLYHCWILREWVSFDRHVCF